MDVPLGLLGSMVIGSMGYFTDPYIWGMKWGYNQLILTIDPNFQWDIQVPVSKPPYSRYVPGFRHLLLGMFIPPLIGNPYHGFVNPSLKLTYPLKTGLAKMKVVFQPQFFGAYVSFRRVKFPLFRVLYTHFHCFSNENYTLDDAV